MMKGIIDQLKGLENDFLKGSLYETIGVSEQARDVLLSNKEFENFFLDTVGSVIGSENPEHEILKNDLMAALESSPDLAQSLSDAVTGDEEFKTRLSSMIENNPEIFRQRLPEITADPSKLKEILLQPLGSQSMQNMRQDFDNSATVEKPEAQPEEQPNARQDFDSAAPGGGQAEEVPELTDQQQQMVLLGEAVDIMSFLEKQNGFKGFMLRIEDNENLQEVFSSFGGDMGDNLDSGIEILRSVKDSVEQDPNFFVKINKFMDDHPGMVNTAADLIADHPEMAKGMMDAMSIVTGMLDMIEELFGPKFREFLENIFGKVMSFLDPNAPPPRWDSPEATDYREMRMRDDIINRASGDESVTSRPDEPPQSKLGTGGVQGPDTAQDREGVPDPAPKDESQPAPNPQ